MQTNFSVAQLADPDLAEANGILRTCVHCGFCTATCPTYVLLGDELDSPRGRIYLIKDMLERGGPVSGDVAKHIDRCLTCGACMTTCPSGVHYLHLIDQARREVERTFVRPPLDRALRRLLARVLPRPGLFRLALIGAWLARPLRGLVPGGRLRAMLDLAPRALHVRSAVDRPQVFPAHGQRRRRVALLSGCAQQVLAPQINEATIRFLTRHGCEVVVARGAGCCGALTQHMGMAAPAEAAARANVEAWLREAEGAGLDAIVINASGCGTTVKEYGHMLRGDPDWADRAARVSALAVDVSELAADLDVPGPAAPTALTIAYQSACSLQHGQGVRETPRRLLEAAGFRVVEPAESHLCCGSAGTYNLLQPVLANQLRDRKTANLERLAPDVIATGNIGCLMQIASGTAVPVVHTVELLDWASGGPKPPALGRVGAT